MNPVMEQVETILLSPPGHKNDYNEEEPMGLSIEFENGRDDHIEQFGREEISNENYALYKRLDEVNRTENLYSLALECCESDNIDVLMQVFENQEVSKIENC